MSEENCGHISIAEYEAFDECRDCLRRWPKKDAPVSDDIDKAAREWAKHWLRDQLARSEREVRSWPKWMREAFQTDIVRTKG
jgi:hypothetical protein